MFDNAYDFYLSGWGLSVIRERERERCALSYEEQIDDENIADDIDPTLEVACEIEVNYDSIEQDFSGPSTSADHAENVGRVYTAETSFGEPTWKKLKPHSFEFSEIDKEAHSSRGKYGS